MPEHSNEPFKKLIEIGKRKDGGTIAVVYFNGKPSDKYYCGLANKPGSPLEAILFALGGMREKYSFYKEIILFSRKSFSII